MFKRINDTKKSSLKFLYQFSSPLGRENEKQWWVWIPARTSFLIVQKVFKLQKKDCKIYKEATELAVSSLNILCLQLYIYIHIFFARTINPKPLPCCCYTPQVCWALWWHLVLLKYSWSKILLQYTSKLITSAKQWILHYTENTHQVSQSLLLKTLCKCSLADGMCHTLKGEYSVSPSTMLLQESKMAWNRWQPSHQYCSGALHCESERKTIKSRATFTSKKARLQLPTSSILWMWFPTKLWEW